MSMPDALSLFLNDPVQAVLLLVAIAAALLNCFFGYPMMKFWIAMAGLAAGYLAASTVAAVFGASLPVQVLAGVLFGILCLVLAVLLYRAGVFVLCALLAFFFARLLFPSVAAWICLIFAAAVGVLAVFLIRPLVIVTTSVQGAVSALSALFTLCNWERNMALYLLAVPLFVLGMLSQFALSRKKKEPQPAAPAQPVPPPPYYTPPRPYSAPPARPYAPAQQPVPPRPAVPAQTAAQPAPAGTAPVNPAPANAAPAAVTPAPEPAAAEPQPAAAPQEPTPDEW